MVPQSPLLCKLGTAGLLWSQLGMLPCKQDLNVNLAQQGPLALATDAGGICGVAESGEIVYLSKLWTSHVEAAYENWKHT